MRTHSISMDNYFKSVSPETTPRTPEGKYDLESPLCMDMELLNEHFSVLSEGGRILVPRYDFVHQCRDLEPSASLRLKKNEVAVFDYLFRGTAAQETLAHWANIRRGEKLYISPFKDKANLQFDSSFAYEVPVLNNTATGLFNAMPSDTPRYSELQSILPAFERFEDVSPELLAKDSLLREFIGGGKYSY